MRVLNPRDRAFNIDPPTPSCPIMRRARPYRGENSGSGEDVRGELDSQARNWRTESTRSGLADSNHEYSAFSSIWDVAPRRRRLADRIGRARPCETSTSVCEDVIHLLTVTGSSNASCEISMRERKGS